MNNQVSTEISTRLIAFRNDHRWSQRQLARALNVSQATVSRLEAPDAQVTDMQLLMTIAALLMCTVTELLPKGVPARVESPVFMAFCPNVLCEHNFPYRTAEGSVDINWRSAHTYPLADFERINFCGFCGKKVIKACPSCGMAIGHAGVQYCRRCGGEVFAEATEKEWKKVKRRLMDMEGEEEMRNERGW